MDLILIKFMFHMKLNHPLIGLLKMKSFNLHIKIINTRTEVEKLLLEEGINLSITTNTYPLILVDPEVYLMRTVFGLNEEQTTD